MSWYLEWIAKNSLNILLFDYTIQNKNFIPFLCNWYVVWILTLVLKGNALIPISNSNVFWTANKAVAVESISNANMAKGYSKVRRTHHVRLCWSKIFLRFWIFFKYWANPCWRAPFLKHIKFGFALRNSSSSNIKPQVNIDIGTGETYDFPVAFACCNLYMQ